VAADDDVDVDIGGVEFIDAAGVRLFVEAAGLLHERGRVLTLVRSPEWLPTILQILDYGDRQGLILQ